LEANYEWIWTGFWWFDDFALLNSGYDAFEEMVLTSDHAKNLEFLCNLAQNLFTAVLHQHLSIDEARLHSRARYDPFNGLNVVDLKILNSTIQNAGNESGESGVFIQNLTGLNTALTNSTFSNNRDWQFAFVNFTSGALGNGGSPFNVSNCTFIAYSVGFRYASKVESALQGSSVRPIAASIVSTILTNSLNWTGFTR